MPMGTGTLYVQHKRLEEEKKEEEEEEEPLTKKSKSVKQSSLIERGLNAVIGVEGEDGPLLRKENASLNVTQRQESLVVQYLALGGFRHFVSQLLGLEDRTPQLACSAVHSGPGQICFGTNHRQRADLILTFDKLNAQSPAVVFIHNYHESRVHYRGHSISCPKYVSKKEVCGDESPLFKPSPHQEFWREMEVDEEDCCFASRAEMEGQSLKMNLDTARYDNFKEGLAAIWSAVAPDNVIFNYSISTACDFFHGAQLQSCLGDWTSDHATLEDLLENEFLSNPKLTDTQVKMNNCKIFKRPPMYNSIDDLVLTSESLTRAIKEGRESGFVTIKGGEERRTLLSNKQEARDHFGFCVQSYACNKEKDISEYTKLQIAQTYNWNLETEEGKTSFSKYIANQPARTLNSTTFHSEETLSTSYLSWLMNERDFCNFEITHFLRYKYVNYWNGYLEPLLAARHEHKKRGNDTASTLNKLFQNAHYGRLGMESSNYDTVILLTGETLASKRKSVFGHLSSKHIVNLGLIRVKCKNKSNKREKRKQTDIVSCEFINSEADEGCDDEEDESDVDDFNTQYTSKKILKQKTRQQELDVIQPFSDSDLDSSDADDDEIEMGLNDFDDLEEQLIHENEDKVGVNERRTNKRSLKKRCKYKIHFLYMITFSGKERPILNNIAGAVAVLSNSKKLFLGHINTMLECGDPRLCELCYIDTDSCIFSMTYISWEDCVKPDKWMLWLSSSVMADEDADSSFHGQLKCEGIYRGGLFKSMKIYRLFDPQGKTPYYSRCKGISRHFSEKLPLSSFDSSLLDKTVVSRNCLKPTPAGQILVINESRQLSIAFNFKRKVDNSGVHSFPVSFVAEC